MGASTIDINVARGLMLGDGFRKLVAKFTGPASYSTGGEAITAGQFRLGVIEYFPAFGLINGNPGTLALIGIYNYDSAKLQYFYTGGAGGAGGSEFAYTPADLKGATTTTAGSVTADQAAPPVNSALYQAATANSVLAGTFALTANPEIGRSIQITINNPTGGALNIFTGGGTVTFSLVGTFRGAAQTDTVVFTVSAGQTSVAAGKARFAQSAKPFDTITAITYNGTATMGAALTLAAGPGSKIGLPQDRLTPADADVLNFAVSAVAQTIAGAFSDTNKTVETGTTADAWDLDLLYRIGAVSSNSLVEVAAGVNLSSYIGRALVHGR